MLMTPFATGRRMSELRSQKSRFGMEVGMRSCIFILMVAPALSFSACGGGGTATAGNIPGARDFTVTWIDESGNFWLFGGLGYDSAATSGYLNDLWKFVP
jgi:hypothetical protein